MLRGTQLPASQRISAKAGGLSLTAVDIARNIALAVLYFGAARLGLAMAFEAAQVTVIWPPTGIALASVLLFGYRMWPGIALGAFLANIIANEPAATALGIATGNTLEALAGAWMLQRAGFDNRLARLRDVLSLVIFSALLSTTISATIGVASLCLGGVHPWESYGLLWRLWWLGDATGMLIVAPPLLAWGSKPYDFRHRHEIAEAMLLLAALLAVCAVIFITSSVNNNIFIYIIFPFVIWAALRFRQRGGTVVILVASAVAILATLQGSGPFAGSSVEQSLILLQLFMGVVAVTGLLLSAAITEQREAAGSKARLGDRLHLMIDNALDAIVTMDQEGRITEWNRQAEAIFGWSLQEVAGKPLAELVIPPEQREAHYQGVRRFLQTGTGPLLNRRVEMTAINRHGERFPVELSISAQKLEGYYYFTSFLRDISERKWAESLLRESEERFRRMADTAPSLIWMSGTDKKCTYFNKPWLDFTGRTMEQELGNGWAEGVHPDDLARCLEVYAISFDKRKPFGMEYRLRRYDGEYRWIIDHGTPRFTAQGNFEGYIGSCIDITAQKRTEAALQDTDRRKNEFLAILAHELRNPIAPILGAAQLLQRSQIDEIHRQEAYNIIARQAQHMKRLVDDLLDISRISHGKFELRKEYLLLADAIHSALESVKPLIEANNHTLTIELATEPLWLDADPTRLSQIFANLLNNAAKYTPPGGEICLSVDADNTMITVKVSDNGPGIPEAMLDKIFHLFTQVEDSTKRSQEGLGLGLTLVKTLAEMHGGLVQARNKNEGLGSEFIVRLPRAASPSPVTMPPSAASPVTAHHFRVLVVEDSISLAKTLGWMLEALGHEARLAHNAESALAEAREFLPNIIMLDLGLPGVNGYDLCQKLHAEPDLKESIFIAQTGWGQPEHRERTRAAGFDYHLVKPVDITTLENLLLSLNIQQVA